MLIEFRVRNFLSFRDNQVLSMVASSDKTLPENTITASVFGKRKLVRSSVLYGPNASGKSNLIRAFDFAQRFVRGSADRTPGTEIPIQQFRLDRTGEESPSEFEVTFIHDGVRYQYGFSVDRRRVHEEWLIAYPKSHPQTWFERSLASDSEKSEWYFGSHLKGEKRRLVSVTRPDVLFLSVAARFDHEQLSQVYRWFSDHLHVIESDTMTSRDFEQLTARMTEKEKNFRIKVRNLLKLADLGIIDVSTEERDDIPSPTPVELLGMFLEGNAMWGELLDVQMWHRTEDRTSPGVPFPLEEESRGTRRLFALSGIWHHSLLDGSTLVVDELDTSLHPHLVRALVSMFHNPHESHNAQLIFNTHDTTLLDLSLFRRDQIWFVEKDNTGASHLYPLLEFSERGTAALEKRYLEGRYGAIPFIDGLLSGVASNVEG